MKDRPWCGRRLSTAPQQDCLLSHLSLNDQMVTYLEHSSTCSSYTKQLELIKPPAELEDTESGKSNYVAATKPPLTCVNFLYCTIVD